MGRESWQQKMYMKRKSFRECVHAAFILDTYYIHEGNINSIQYDWLFEIYPNSINSVQKSVNNGIKTVIHPKF